MALERFGTINAFKMLRLTAEQMIKNQLVDGIVGMTLPIARHLASYGVRVKTVVPGLIHTPLFNSSPQNVIDALSARVLTPNAWGAPRKSPAWPAASSKTAISTASASESTAAFACSRAS